jgi:hypothetical protein
MYVVWNNKVHGQTPSREFISVLSPPRETLAVRDHMVAATSADM